MTYNIPNKIQIFLSRFALANVKFALAVIVKNFKLLPHPRTQYPLKINPGSVQLEPVNRFWMKFKKI